jgi:hypothetical protein
LWKAGSTIGVGELDEEHPPEVQILCPVRVPNLFEWPDARTGTLKVLYPTIKFITGFASNPGTDVLPTCSTVLPQEPTAASICERSKPEKEG